LENELVSIFKQFTPIARNAEGNLSIQLMQDQDDRDLLMFYQRWESREHQEQYLAQFRERGNYEIIDPFLDGGPVIHYFDDTTV
jgi:quinol monooxygenase YgiN